MTPSALTSPRRAALAIGLACLAGTLAWASLSPRGAAAGTDQAADWRTVSSASFAAQVEVARARLKGSGEAREAELSGVLKSLAGDPRTAARAAVLLGLVARDAPAAGPDRSRIASALLELLEARVKPKTRGSTGVELVAAQVLGELLAAETGRAETQAALVALSAGDAPHPDLATRVACAEAVLTARADGRVVPFLLAVLRAETPGQAKSPRTWERITTLAWVKTRASGALARAVGTESRFRPDGSWAHQTAESDRLETLARAQGLLTD